MFFGGTDGMKNAQEIISAIQAYSRTVYRPEEYPALSAQTRLWQQTLPLKGLRILDATPLFANTLLKYIPLLAAGAELTAATHDGIPYDPAMLPLLKQWGLPHVHNAGNGSYDCILDCGGVHAGLKPSLGFGELTRSGFYHFSQTASPVILVDDSRIKAIETCLGTGDGFLRGMKQLGCDSFKGKKVLIFGFGKVGRGIAYYAAREGAEIIIADRPEVQIPEKYGRKISCEDRTAVREAVRSAWCVVTATGIRGAMCGNGAAEELRTGHQLVAAMGIEDEWCGTLPDGRILNQGKPLNFLLPEPTRLRYIDPTMALSNAAALELRTHRFPPGIRKIDSAVEQRYWEIVETGGLIAGELKGTGI